MGTRGSPGNPHRCLLDFPPPQRPSCSPRGPNKPGPALVGASRDPLEEEVSSVLQPHFLRGWRPQATAFKRTSKISHGRGALKAANPHGPEPCTQHPHEGLPPARSVQPAGVPRVWEKGSVRKLAGDSRPTPSPRPPQLRGRQRGRAHHRLPASREVTGRMERGFTAIFKPVKVELSCRSPPGTQLNRPSHRQK